MKIVVIGGSGLIGSKLVTKLGEQGHQAVAASPNSGVNTLTGEGLAEVLVGASVVVDVSNSPSWEDKAVMEFFTTSTRNLLQYEAAAGVRPVSPGWEATPSNFSVDLFQPFWWRTLFFAVLEFSIRRLCLRSGPKELNRRACSKFATHL